MNTRKILLVAGGFVGIGALGYGLGTVIGDPTRPIDEIRTTGVRVSNPAAAASASSVDPTGSSPTEPITSASVPPARTESVDGLEQLVGILREGSDIDTWYVNGVELDIGPEGWLFAAPALGDFNADGVDDGLLAELRSLDGREVTFGVRYEIEEDDRDDAEVFTISGLTYRELTGPAPWQLADPRPEATRAELEAAAVAAVGPGAQVTDIDRELDDSWPGWDVEVVGPGGIEYQVLLDLAGDVLDIRVED